jgi:hypothetical protein
MGAYFPNKSRSADRNARRWAFQQPGRKSILYRVLATGGMFAIFMSTAVILAQESTPEIRPLENSFNKRKDQGPRAVALVRLASNGKVTLVPIAIRIDGKFYDAAAYKADPVPMALESGTIYEAERTGKSLGLFTVSGALRSNAINAVTPWIGTGLWLPEGTEAPKSGRKAETVPVGIESSDAPPRLTKSKSERKADPQAPATTSPTPPATSSPESKPSSTEAKPNGGQSPPDSATKPNSDTAKKADQTSPSTDDTNSSAGDTNRPRLRRGKPTQPLPSDDDVPGYSRPGSRAAKNTEASVSKSNSGPTADASAQLIPAISDADGPNPRSYAFEWIKGEEADRRKQLMDLASAQLRLYLAKQSKASIVANSAVPKTASRQLPSKPPEPVFDNVEMRTFDLWANNQPIMVLTAEARVPPAAKNTAAPTPDSSAQYTITLVARTDIYNNLHKLYVGITDKYHLDITPRLELIDAVDADGDGRGELLFRETSDAGTGWLIYKASADKLWKMYDSLHPE